MTATAATATVTALDGDAVRRILDSSRARPTPVVSSFAGPPARAGGGSAGVAGSVRGVDPLSLPSSRLGTTYGLPFRYRDEGARRDLRYELRRVLWAESSKTRTQVCGRNRLPARQRQLRVRDDGEQAVAHFTGAMVCGSPWACPVCSAKIAAARADEIGRGVGAWVDADNFAVLVSLTVQHGRSDALGDTLDAVLKAFQAVTSGRAWIAEREACRIAGVIKGVEVTWGAGHGWHPHLHAVVLFEGCPDPVSYARMIDRWMFCWQRAAERHGFGASLEHGVRFDTVTSGIGAGEYVCKTLEGRGIGAEVACGDLKSGRLGSLTPMEILEYFSRTGDMAALDLWREYERATHGRRRVTWSRGLRQRLLAGVPELTDKEIAEAEVGGDVVAIVPDDTWRVMCFEPGLMVSVLRAAEAGGFQAVVDVLAPYGVTVRPPPGDRQQR